MPRDCLCSSTEGRSHQEIQSRRLASLHQPPVNYQLHAAGKQFDIRLAGALTPGQIMLDLLGYRVDMNDIGINFRVLVHHDGSSSSMNSRISSTAISLAMLSCSLAQERISSGCARPRPPLWMATARAKESS